ncbi:MAG TPA: hypothetical protein VM938_05210 [Acidimicrobiales bacterium]|nr:hypothetical protein [Acidimicrobiales bacterium]
MKKVFAVILGVLGMLGAAAGMSTAEPGPNGKNDHGLCTAYFNGQKVGHNGAGPEDPDDPRPFQGLEDAGRDYTDTDGRDNDNDNGVDEEGENTSLTAAENVFNYCHDHGLIGGNPEHGRFTCADTGTTASTDQDTDPECNRNEKPGKG